MTNLLIPHLPLDAPLEAGLYIVPMPIGNIFDITLRALQVLTLCDILLCEDTRKTKPLLQFFKVSKILSSYHDHNESLKSPWVLKKLLEGKSVALVCDAGTPLLSDPGFRLVRQAIAQDIRVHSLPGASSLLCALVASGLKVHPFTFVGFLKSRAQARQEELKSYQNRTETLVIFEAPHRVKETLVDIDYILGEGHIVIARELTKKYEELIRGSLKEVIHKLDKREALKGEMVLLFEPIPVKVKDSEIKALLAKRMEEVSLKEAVDEVSDQLHLSRREVYRLALQVKEGV